jgi:nucleotide-binding universal stress UspA family protein
MPPQNILLATDLEGRTDRAMDRAVRLASTWDTRLVVAHAVESTWKGSHPRTGDAIAEATKRIREELRDAGAMKANVVAEKSAAAPLILSTIERAACELVVTGAGRTGLGAMGQVSSGGTVDALLRESPIPVLVVKARPNRPYRHLLIATDFSEGSRDALMTAIEMFPDARVTLFHAYDVLYEGFIDDKRAARDAAARHASARVRAFLEGMPVGNRELAIRCEHGAPEQALRRLISEDGDLVVVGSRNRGLVAEFFLGSVAKAILGEASCDVLIVRDQTRRTWLS